jgi:hypothetical protein
MSPYEVEGHTFALILKTFSDKTGCFKSLAYTNTFSTKNQLLMVTFNNKERYY